jgi:hypothetical protein
VQRGGGAQRRCALTPPSPLALRPLSRLRPIAPSSSAPAARSALAPQRHSVAQRALAEWDAAISDALAGLEFAAIELVAERRAELDDQETYHYGAVGADLGRRGSCGSWGSSGADGEDAFPAPGARPAHVQTSRAW